MKQKRWMAAGLAGLMLCTLLAGCGGSGAGNADEGNDKAVELTIVSSNNTHGTVLDPAVEYCGARNVDIGVCETLFNLEDETLDVACHLASDYEHVDEKTWCITIRDGISFSNGKPLTAKEAKESLEYVLGGITRLSTMLDVASIEAQGQKLTIRTNSVVATLPRLLTGIGFTIFDMEGTQDYATGVIGTGPYILESIDDDGNCALVRNETYWQGMPGADRIHTKFITDASATTLAMQSGELDYAEIQASDISLFENNDDYEVMGYETGRVYYLYLNPGYSFTQDPLLCEALTYAFHRQAYLDGVYAGQGQATTTIFPTWSGYSAPEISQGDYDMGTAKATLQAGGYVDTDGDGFVEKDGEPVSLTITCYARNGFSTLSQVVQASLKDLGIDSNIVVSDAIVADLTEGNYNIATYGYTTLTLGDCFNFLEPVFRTGASSNFNGFSSAKVDALMDEMKATSDIETRKALAIEMQKEIFAANHHVFLMHISSYKVVRAGVENVSTGLGDNFNLWKITK